MKTDFSCGIIPVRVRQGGRQYLVVQHQRGHWAFPKGHPEPGETHVQTARRELAEETGLDGVRVIEAHPLLETYIFTKRSGRRVRKTVKYFIGLVPEDVVVTPQPDEVIDYAWGSATETRRRLTFPESQHLLDEAEAYLAALHRPASSGADDRRRG